MQSLGYESTNAYKDYKKLFAVVYLAASMIWIN